MDKRTKNRSGEVPKNRKVLPGSLEKRIYVFPCLSRNHGIGVVKGFKHLKIRSELFLQHIAIVPEHRESTGKKEDFPRTNPAVRCPCLDILYPNVSSGPSPSLLKY